MANSIENYYLNLGVKGLEFSLNCTRSCQIQQGYQYWIKFLPLKSTDLTVKIIKKSSKKLTVPFDHQTIPPLPLPLPHHHYQGLHLFHLQTVADPFLDLTSSHLLCEDCWVHQYCLKIPIEFQKNTDKYANSPFCFPTFSSKFAKGICNATRKCDLKFQSKTLFL